MSGEKMPAADKRIIRNLNDLELVMKLMKANRIDFVELDGIKLQKSRHDDTVMASPPEVMDEETLFYSSR